MDTQKMVHMANQIADFFNGYPHDDALRDAAAHLNSYWDPRMRKQLFAHLAKGGEGLDPLIIEAAAQIRKPKTEVA